MPPGGHIDDNETPEECAQRECKEETGLDVEILGQEEILKLRNDERFSRFQDFKISRFQDSANLFADCPQEGSMLKTPIAMLLENIPDCPERGEGAHQHMDFLFLAQPIDETQESILAEEEGEAMRWFTNEEISALDDATEIFGNVKHYILSVL